MNMLDERTAVLLKILNKKCSFGSYKVVTSDELILEFPERFGADKDLIWQMLVTLSQKGYLSIRYDRDGEFCLSLTPKGRLYCETDLKEERTQNKPKTDLLPYIYNFMAIFFGIVFGGLTLIIIGALC